MTTLTTWTQPGSLRADIVALRNDDADSILRRIEKLLLDRTEVRVARSPRSRRFDEMDTWVETDWSDIVVDITDGPASVPHVARRCSAMDDQRPVEVSFSVRKVDEYETPEGRRLVVYGVEEGWGR